MSSYVHHPDLHEDITSGDGAASWCAAGGIFATPPEEERGARPASDPDMDSTTPKRGPTSPATPRYPGSTPNKLGAPTPPTPGTPPEATGGGGMEARGGGLALGLGSVVPQGVDLASYLAGEAAALQRSFQQALPGQELLGHLQAQVAHISSWLQQESARIRRLEAAGSGMQAHLTQHDQRVGALEHTRLPGVEAAVADARAELRDNGASLRAYREQVEREDLARRRGSPAMLLSRLAQRVFEQLVAQASQMDVALLFLARKILVWEGAGGGADPSQMSVAQRRRAIFASALMVVTSEVFWRAHGGLVQPLPRTLRLLLAPVGTGLNVLRTAVWSAAFFVSAWTMKSVCYELAGAVSPAQGGTEDGAGQGEPVDGEEGRGGEGGHRNPE